MSPSTCVVAVLGLSLLVPGVLARAPETPPHPSIEVTSRPIRPEPYLLHQGVKITAGDTVYFGGTTWAADSARWEALPDSVWTFDTGVGSFLVQPGMTPPGVDPYKRVGLHGGMEGWIGYDASYVDATRFLRRVDAADPRWNGIPCVGAAAGLGGSYSFWAGVFEIEADSLCYVGGKGYGNSWDVCLVREFTSAGGSVQLGFDVLLDSEEDFDFLAVSSDTGGVEPIALAEYSGFLAQHDDLLLSPGSELPAGPGPVTLRFCFHADGLWSDEDGLNPTSCGAFAVDDIVLTGGIEDTSDFEIDDDGWEVLHPDPAPGGDWSHLAALSDLPAIPDSLLAGCTVSDSVLVLFDPDLPLDGPHPEFQQNYAVSPWIDLARAGIDSEHRGRVLVTDAFAELPEIERIFASAMVQWYPDTCTVTGMPRVSPWMGPEAALLPHEADPTCYSRRSVDLTNFVPGHAQQIRIALVVWNQCRFFVGCPGTSNRTPWFDNVRFGVYRENSLQALIDSASPGDSIIVPPGTYLGSAGVRDLDFRGKNLVFWAPAGPESTIIDCEGLGQGLLFLQGEGPTCVVDGFTIRNGDAGTGPTARGGGIYMLASSPTIRNCVIDSCRAGYGGGVYTNTALYLRDCTIQDNEASDFGGGIYASIAYDVGNVIVRRNTADQGGGMAMAAGTLTGVEVLENQARVGGGILFTTGMPEASDLRACVISGNVAAQDGGGLFRAAVLDRCTLENNTAGRFGGGAYLTAGSADSCRVGGNSAGMNGGGLYLNTGTLVARTFTLTNTLTTGNRAAQSGGGIWAGGSAGWTLLFTGSTLTGNAAQNGGGMYAGATGLARLHRSISWANAAAAQGHNLFVESGSEVTTSCAAVDTLAAIDGPGTVTHLGGLVDSDPMFCSSASPILAPTAEGDYSLFVGSPCLPGPSPCDSLIGALGFGCAVVPVLPPPDDDEEDVPFLTAPGILAGPNPFIGELAIHYLSPSGTDPRVEIFAIDGRRVASYAVRPGSGTVVWPGVDAAGRRVASGVYLVRFTAGGLTVVRRVVKTR